MARLEKINRDGYHVKVQWECEFHNDCIAQPTVCKSPLCTRDALYGGRTEAMRLHYKALEGETIQYLDVMRLYPFVCKNGKFPVGHPVVHVGDACKEGLMKCTIVPPERLYHPVLPFRANHKLMFSLCRTCVLTSNTGQCCHKTDEKRALNGTWVIDELRLAVRKVYRILEIHEEYEYNVTKYDTETRLGCLFSGYLDSLLKLKSEASASPAWVRNPADEERYIESFWKSEGIRLYGEAIKPNAAKRGLAKLCLNSIWENLTRDTIEHAQKL